MSEMVIDGGTAESFTDTAVLITTEDVQAWLGSTHADATELGLCVAAADAFVNKYTDSVTVPDDMRKLGAIMLAARWYTRRSSSTGVQSFDQYGISYVARYDQDIWRLLGLNKPVVA